MEQSDNNNAVMIRCDNLYRVYDQGRVTAVAGVDLDIHQGEYVALMGPSGSGKSTLLNLISAMDRPTSGEVYFQGKPLSDRALANRLRSEHVGFVFQAFHLLPTLTALENVQVPMFESKRPAARRAEKAAQLLDWVGLSKRAHHRPGTLSGGERQRVAVARALANDPVALLADEPTGNLDTVTGEEIMSLLEKLHREHNMALVVVTHSQEIGDRADRLIRMRDGQIIEDRTSERLTTSPVQSTT